MKKKRTKEEKDKLPKKKKGRKVIYNFGHFMQLFGHFIQIM